MWRKYEHVINVTDAARKTSESRFEITILGVLEMHTAGNIVGMIIDLLTKNWWLLLVRGILAIVFGIAIFAMEPFFLVPFVREITFALLAVLFGWFALTCGLLTTLASLRSLPWMAWALLADGGLILLTGLLVVFLPGLTLTEVMYLIGCAAVLAGISEIAVAVALRRNIKHEWLLMTAGFGSAAFGVYLGVAGGHDLTSVLRATCAYALVSGFAVTAFAIRLHKLPSQKARQATA